MAVEKLEFTKDWTNPEDFPTVEISETKVREDMQFLFNEIKAYLNCLAEALDTAGVEHAALLPEENARMKYIRLGASGDIEVSTDGKTWLAVAGSGANPSTLPAHAARHAANGDDPLTPDSIGAYTKEETDEKITAAISGAMGGSY